MVGKTPHIDRLRALGVEGGFSERRCVLYLGIIVVNIHVGSRVEYMEGKGGGFGRGRCFNLKSKIQQL